MLYIKWYFETHNMKKIKNIINFFNPLKIKDLKKFEKLIQIYGLEDKFIAYNCGYYKLNKVVYQIIFNSWKKERAFDHSLLRNLFIPAKKYHKLFKEK